MNSSPLGTEKLSEICRKTELVCVFRIERIMSLRGVWAPGPPPRCKVKWRASRPLFRGCPTCNLLLKEQKQSSWSPKIMNFFRYQNERNFDVWYKRSQNLCCRTHIRHKTLIKRLVTFSMSWKWEWLFWINPHCYRKLNFAVIFSKSNDEVPHFLGSAPQMPDSQRTWSNASKE